MTFSIRSLFLVTGFVAIWTLAHTVAHKYSGFLDHSTHFHALSLFLPEFVPIIFVAYALGRRRLSLAILTTFGICQAASFLPTWFLWQQ